MTTETKPEQKAAGIWVTFRESPLAVKAVLGGVFVNKIGGFLNIFLVLFMASQGYTADQAAAALGAYGAGAVIGVLAGGALSDRLGARNATVISMGSSAVLIASLLYLPNYGLLLAAVLLVGAVSQIYRPASAALLSELTPATRQVMTFAMYRFGLNLGTTAAPLIGYALYNLDGQHYTLLFWGEALVALAYAALAMVALPAKARRPVADVPASAETAKPAEEHGSYLAVLRDRRYLLFLIAMFFNGIVYIQYLVTLPLDVEASNVELFWYTFAVSLNGLAVILFELPVTKITQHWPMRISVGWAFAFVGLGMAFYGLPLGPAVIIIATLVWTLGEIGGGPAVFAYPGMAGPPRLRSHYIGSFQFMYALGNAIGPVIGGALFVRFGHNVWPILAAGSAVAAVLGVSAIRKPPEAGQIDEAAETEERAAETAVVGAEPVVPEEHVANGQVIDEQHSRS
jgi:MFS family permease